MSDDFYIVDQEPNMKLAVARHVTNPQFQKVLLETKSMRGKLAACYAMLSQQGVFSDSPAEVWALRQEVAEHTPEEFRDG